MGSGVIVRPDGVVLTAYHAASEGLAARWLAKEIVKMFAAARGKAKAAVAAKKK